MERVWDGVSLEGTPPCHGGSFRWLSRKSCEQYASSVYEACRDAFRHLFDKTFGADALLCAQQQVQESGQQTLGEEYCDITQVGGPFGLPPTPARRALYIVYHTAVPYIAERISSRIASRGIVLTDSQSAESYGENAPGSIHFQTFAASEFPSSLTRGQNITTLTWLKQKLSAFWLHMVRGWPTIY